MDFVLSFNTLRSGIWGTCICLWILKQKSITSVPSFAALCLLCNTKRDKDSVTPTWLDRNPLSESSECEWVYFKDFYFFFEIDFFSSHIYTLAISLDGHLSGIFFSSFFSLSHCSSLSFPTALSHCITFSSALVTLNKNRLRRPQEHEPNTYTMHCA